MSDETLYLSEEPTPEPAPATPPERETGWHPVNVGHLVMGLVFLCAVVAWALVQTDTVSGRDLRWLLPLPWVVGGAVGLTAAAVSGVRRHGVRR
jgi:hypothetical protein